MAARKLNAVVLTVDCDGGVVLTIFERGEPDTVQFGVARGDRLNWARDALKLADECDLPLVVVAEQNAILPDADWFGSFGAIKRACIPLSCVVRPLRDTWWPAIFGFKDKVPNTHLRVMQTCAKHVTGPMGMYAMPETVSAAMVLRQWAGQAEEVRGSIAATLKASKAKAKTTRAPKAKKKKRKKT